MKQQDEKIMTFGNKNILAWDKQWNMTALLITAVHSRLNCIREKLIQAAFTKSTSSFIISVLRSTTMRFKYSQTYTSYQAMC